MYFTALLLHVAKFVYSQWQSQTTIWYFELAEASIILMYVSGI
jgi:hypothetical protein